MKRLMLRAVVRWLCGLVLCGMLLFLPAGTWAFDGAWRFLGVLFLPMAVLGVVLLIRAPGLLEKRLNAREGEAEQRRAIALSAALFIGMFVLCGLDRRFGWTQLPAWTSYAGCAVFLLCYAGFAELLRENAYLSRTVEVQAGQQVVSTGMYGIVRHPMYFILLFLFLSMPVIIGSAIGILPLLPMPAVLVKRIRNEEEVLKRGLKGYKAYMQRVRYRLIPYLW